MAQASSSEIAAATVKGSKSKMDNGDTLHTYRHPSSPDHEITVVTRNGKVMKSNVTFKPIKEVEVKRKQKEQAKTDRTNRSKANQAARLEKKRARSAQASNKKGNKTKN